MTFYTYTHSHTHTRLTVKQIKLVFRRSIIHTVYRLFQVRIGRNGDDRQLRVRRRACIIRSAAVLRDSERAIDDDDDRGNDKLRRYRGGGDSNLWQPEKSAESGRQREQNRRLRRGRRRRRDRRRSNRHPVGSVVMMSVRPSPSSSSSSPSPCAESQSRRCRRQSRYCGRPLSLSEFVESEFEAPLPLGGETAMPI